MIGLGIYYLGKHRIATITATTHFERVDDQKLGMDNLQGELHKIGFL